MKNFQADMDRIRQKVKTRERLLYKAVTAHVERSIKYGSAVTGAPGQPVQSGALLRSYKRKKLGARRDEVSSDLIYAPIIEDNRRGAQLRSDTGGFHSIKLTRIGFRRIVEHELRKVKGASGGGLGLGAPRMMRDEGGRFTGKEASLEING